MIRVFRVAPGERTLLKEQEGIVAGGWYILSVKQSTIYGKEIDGAWRGEWLVRCVPKSWFFWLDNETQMRIRRNEKCLN